MGTELFKPRVKGTTKSGGKKHALDKFYTNPKVAEYCLSLLALDDYDLVIEPSAGNGSFSNLIDNVLAFDLEPENSSIIKQDWFTYSRSRSEGRVLVVGNPPFGQQNNLTLQFVNHAALFASTIAFVLPISFMKESVQNKIDKNFHLTASYFLPKKSFLLNGDPVDVPCVFQVWDFSSVERVVVPTPEMKGFRFVRKEDNPDFYIQRIGGGTGTIGRDVGNRSVQSNYFVKADDEQLVDALYHDFSLLSHPTKSYSVGPRSISKKEILLELKSFNSDFVV